MIDQRVLTDMNLILLQDGRNRNDHCKILGVALEIISQRQNCSVVIPNHHHFGGLIENLGVGFSHIETAERVQVGTG